MILTNGGIKFGVHRTKMMKALIHWVHYFSRISLDPTIIGLNEFIFIQQLDTTMHKEEIRK